MKHRSRRVIISLLLGFCFAWASGAHASVRPLSAKAITGLDIPFVANQGQYDSSVAYRAVTFAGAVSVTADGTLLYTLKDRPVFSERFAGGSTTGITGAGVSGTKVSFFKGKDPAGWKTGIPAFREISFGEVYPGVEVKVKAHGNNVEKLFRVTPEGTPRNIRLAVTGTKRLAIDRNGQLVVETARGPVVFTKPVAWQEENGQRIPIDVSYALAGRTAYTFSVMRYDRSRDLVIDPLLTSTFLGGSSEDSAYGIAEGTGTDSSVYITGNTGSSNFPKTAGAHDTDFQGAADGFVAKFDRNLTTLKACTFIGGDQYEYATSILVRGDEVVVCGFTTSTDFPVTEGAYSTALNGSSDAFIARFSGDLATLRAATYLGGGSYEQWPRIDALPLTEPTTLGDIFIIGETYSTDFPIVNEFGTSYDSQMGMYRNYYSDFFIARLTPDLTTLRASTYLGGTGAGTYGYGYEYRPDIAVEPTYGVYVTGVTGSQDFPTTPSAYNPTFPGNDAVLVSNLDFGLTTLNYSTCLGPSYSGRTPRIALTDAAPPEVYVAGYAYDAAFPVTPGAYNTTFNNTDGFVSCLNETLSTLKHSTFLGGSSYETIQALALAPGASGGVYVAGWTVSDDFPVTPNAYKTTKTTSTESFVARFSHDLSTLPASTFLSDEPNDNECIVGGMVVSQDGTVCLAGNTMTSAFPTRSNAYDPAYNGGSQDAYVLRFDRDLSKAGDISADGLVNITDVILCLRQAIGLDPIDLSLADMNNDGLVNITDVILVLRKAIGLDVRAKH